MNIEFKPDKIKLIIGLGNPGRTYENTYHSVGFLFIDYLTKNLPISNFSAKGGSASGGQFLISNTFMNESGSAVKKELKKHNAEPAELLVIHDDSDLPLGSYKLVFDRGAAGHKGVASVIKTLKTQKFWRLRIGIRQQNSKLKIRAGLPAVARRAKAGDFVLKRIGAADKKILTAVFGKTVRLLLL